MTSLRLLTYVIFAYTTVEGLVINVSYPSTLPFIYKDFVIALAYFAMMTGGQSSSGSISKIWPSLVGFGVVTCFFLAMPSQVSLLGELVAIKQRVFYIPLIWLGYRFTRSDDDLLALIKVMAWTAIPAALFGIYLYFVGPVGLARVGANYSAFIGSTSGEHHESFWRVPGTFTSPGQYGMFLMANAVLFVGVLFTKGVEKRQYVLTIAALVVTLAALLVSGSRTPLLIFMLCSVAMLAATGRLTGIGLWVGGLYGVFTVGFTYFGGGVQDRVGSIASWEHVQRFENTYFGQLFWQFLMEAPMGFGLGRATLGARHFTDLSNVMLVESYLGLIVAETGFLGLGAFLWALLTVVVTLISCRTVMRHSPSNLLWYSVTFLVLAIAGILPVSAAIDSAPGNLYFWFFLGAALRLYDIEVARRRGPVAQNGQDLRPAAMYPVSYQ